MELTEAQALATRVYHDELEMIETRRGVTQTRNRIRKLAPARGADGLTGEARDEWEWWSGNSATFARLPFCSSVSGVASQMSELVSIMAMERGVDGYAALRAAGFVLLDWLTSRGGAVTATKFGGARGEPGPDDNLYSPSYAVDFLAQQFALIDPALDDEAPERPGSNVATDAAYRVARAYLSAQSG